MPLPVITDVYRVSIEHPAVNGCAPANVIHVGATGANATDVLADVLAALSGNDIWSGLQTAFGNALVTVTPLDGTSASVTGLAGTSGGGASGQIVFESAAIVSFKTAVRGPRGRGRMFVGPMTEADIDTGTIVASRLTQLLADVGDFITALPTGTTGCGLLVASYVHLDANPVTSFVVRSYQGLQGRRLKATR